MWSSFRTTRRRGETGLCGVTLRALCGIAPLGVNLIVVLELLKVLRKFGSVEVKNKVHNALVDVYRDKTCYPEVFNELKVGKGIWRELGKLGAMGEDQEKIAINVEQFLDWRKEL